MKTVLQGASKKSNPVLHDGDFDLIFSDFLAQTKGGISREVVTKWGSAKGRIGANGRGNGILYIRTYESDQDWSDASGIVNELPHVAGSKGGWPREEYDDYALAVALYKSPYSEEPTGPAYDPFSAFPDLTAAGKTQARYDERWSNYFHHVLRKHCVVPKGGTP
jgi:hypothetical protein